MAHMLCLENSIAE